MLAYLLNKNEFLFFFKSVFGKYAISPNFVKEVEIQDQMMDKGVLSEVQQ